MDYAEREEYVQLAARLLDVLGPSDPRGLPARIASQLDWLESANKHDPWAQDLVAMLSALFDELEWRARSDRVAWLTLTRVVRTMYERDVAPSSSGILGSKLAHLSHRLFVAEDLPQPSRSSGNALGVGPAAESVSEVGMAALVDAVAGQLRRNGHEPPLYTTDTSPARPGLTVIGILREGLHDRGISLGYADVVRIYEEASAAREG